MATYDPQRSRSRPRAADPEAPAPVDALLGPVTDPEPVETAESSTAPDDAVSPGAGARADTETADTETGRSAREPLVIDLDAPAPAGDAGRRGGTARAAVLALVAAAVAAIAWLWYRRRA